MSVQILTDQETGYKVLYCSTTMKPLSEMFLKDEDVHEFLEWLKVDPRLLLDEELYCKVSEWRIKDE